MQIYLIKRCCGHGYKEYRDIRLYFQKNKIDQKVETVQPPQALDLLKDTPFVYDKKRFSSVFLIIDNNKKEVIENKDIMAWIKTYYSSESWKNKIIKK